MGDTPKGKGKPKSKMTQRVQKFLEWQPVEAVIVASVLAYAIFVLGDLGFGWPLSPQNLLYLDMAFLSFFMLEITVKLYAYGLEFAKDVFNSIDAVVILISFVFSIISLESQIDMNADVSSAGVQNNMTLLRIIRVVRIFRVLLVMNKIQKSRDKYKRAKYLKVGSPVEKVFEILGELKESLDGPDDQENIQWILELIANETLYKVNFNPIENTEMGAELTDWLNAEMGVSAANNEGPDPAERKAKESMKRNSIKPSHLDHASSMNLSPEMQANLATEKEKEKGAASWVDKILGEANIQPLLAKCSNWDFDIFEWHTATNDHPTVAGLYHLFSLHQLFEKFKISKTKFLDFATKIEKGYKPQNPYHNHIHAADVLFTTHYYIQQEQLQQHMGPLDQMGALIAAAIHDFEHPGVNNAFLTATRSEYAITYNDQSVLEMHHVAAAYKLLLTKECNIFESLSREQWVDIRETIVTLVLGTDMKFHFEHLTRFKTKIAADGYQNPERKDLRFLLSMAVHAADISNPVKPQKVYIGWTLRVMEEFFQQGDREQAMGLPISPFMDREKTSPAQCQIGFVNILVKPLHQEWTSFLGENTVLDCMGPLNSNVAAWENEGNTLLNGQLRYGSICVTKPPI